MTGFNTNGTCLINGKTTNGNAAAANGTGNTYTAVENTNAGSTSNTNPSESATSSSAAAAAAAAAATAAATSAATVAAQEAAARKAAAAAERIKMVINEENCGSSAHNCACNGTSTNSSTLHSDTMEPVKFEEAVLLTESFTSLNDCYSYELIKDIADFLLARTDIRPKVGIICGSGLNSIADCITDTKAFEYEDIPHFPVSTVEGHVGRMIFGYLEDMPVVAMQGRFHYYEGYPLAKCSMPVRVMKLLGIEFLMATNAAGGLNPKFKVGDIMIVRDHINIMGFAGNSPLQGPNDPRFGPRFPPMTNAYDPHLIRKAKKVAKEMGIENDVHEGVYTCLGGPNYETVAELKMLRIMGVDAVGMSTVHEVITARHCDLTVFAFSLITNKCAMDYDSGEEDANHEEVVLVGKSRQTICGELMCRVIREIGNDIDQKNPKQ